MHFRTSISISFMSRLTCCNFFQKQRRNAHCETVRSVLLYQGYIEFETQIEMTMKRTFAFLTLATFMSMSLAAAEVGRPAPEFSATDINGQTHKLSDYKGKIVVLESYNQDCPFCHNHYKTGAMQHLQRELTAKGVIWLLVNSVAPKYSNHRTSEAAKKEWADQKIA